MRRILSLAAIAAVGASLAPGVDPRPAQETRAVESASKTSPAKHQPARTVASVDAAIDLRWRRLRRSPGRYLKHLRDKPWGGSVKKHARAMAQKRRAAA